MNPSQYNRLPVKVAFENKELILPPPGIADFLPEGPDEESDDDSERSQPLKPGIVVFQTENESEQEQHGSQLRKLFYEVHLVSL